MRQLTKHFTLEELTASQTATRLNINNNPADETVAALTALCENVLEPLRALLDCAVFINSGYRSPVLNVRVGGAKTSQHCKGEAADLAFKGVSVQDAFEKLRASSIDFDQVIEEGTWLHVSYTTKRANRRQCLRARFVDGVAHYSEA